MIITDRPSTVSTHLERNDVADLLLFREEVLQARTWMGRITLSEPVSSWLLTALAFAFAVAAGYAITKWLDTLNGMTL